jgi:NhaP-type Na+/H+ or K+/H+ antiporter
MHSLEYILVMLFAVLLSNLISQRLSRISTPLVQVGLGIVISLLPVFNYDNTLDPEFFLVLFIAPLLFEDAKKADKPMLWRHKRPILLLALGLVFATCLAVGVFMDWLIPAIGLPAALAFAAALAPTDAVSVGLMRKTAQIDDDQRSLLQGEALFNDASSIVSFQFALAALAVGPFAAAAGLSEWLFFGDIAVTFLVMFLGGVLVGVVLMLVRYLVVKVIRASGIESITFHVLFELLTPLLVFLIAESLHVSGIIAVVAAGILHSFSGRRQTPENARHNIVSTSVWGVVGFSLNGIVFLILGTQLPTLAVHAWNNSAVGFGQMLLAMLLGLLAILAIRFVWVLVIRRNVAIASAKDKLVEDDAATSAREAPMNACAPDSESIRPRSVWGNDATTCGNGVVCPDRAGANWPEDGRAMIHRRLPRQAVVLNEAGEALGAAASPQADKPLRAAALPEADDPLGASSPLESDNLLEADDPLDADDSLEADGLPAERRVTIDLNSLEERIAAHFERSDKAQGKARAARVQARLQARAAARAAAAEERGCPGYRRAHLHDALLMSLMGVKGAITLALLLTAPLLLPDGSPFPERNLLLFLASGIIVLSLVLANFLVPLIAPRHEQEPTADDELRAISTIYRSVIRDISEHATPKSRSAADTVIRQYDNRLRRLLRDNAVFNPEEEELRRRIVNWSREHTLELVSQGQVSFMVGIVYFYQMGRLLGHIEHHGEKRWMLLDILRQAARQLRARRRWRREHPGAQKPPRRPMRVALIELQNENYRMALRRLDRLMAEPDAPIAAINLMAGDLRRRRDRLRDAERPLQALSREKFADFQLSVLDIETRALHYEREAIERQRKAGRISRETARHLRDNVSIMEIDIEQQLE